MDNKYFKSKDESSLEARFSEQQAQNTQNASDISTQTSQLSQITNSGTITGFVVLTQAEYDALPNSKLTDGKVYLITGA